MPTADLGRVSLYYEVSGPENGEPLVLIHGLGAQMIAWYPGFIELLEKTGFKVIRFDNRDVGLSSKMEDGEEYTLDDMAEDVVGLMRYLGLDSAHVAGQSMGGMIAQQLVISHPEAVRSVTIIYSTPSREYFNDDPKTYEIRHRPPAKNREEAIRNYIEQEHISGMDEMDDSWIQTFAATVIDRCYYPEGSARQETALRAAPDRLSALKSVAVPAALIHGRNDRLLDYRGGVAIAAAIPDAELHVYSNMGHQVVPRLWPDFVRVMRRTAERAGAFNGCNQKV